MSDDQVRLVMMHEFGLRIQPQMSQYLQRRLLKRDQPVVPVIGGDARTGVARRTLITLEALERAAAALPLHAG